MSAEYLNSLDEDELIYFATSNMIDLDMSLNRSEMIDYILEELERRGEGRGRAGGGGVSGAQMDEGPVPNLYLGFGSANPNVEMQFNCRSMNSCIQRDRETLIILIDPEYANFENSDPEKFRQFFAKNGFHLRVESGVFIASAPGHKEIKIYLSTKALATLPAKNHRDCSWYRSLTEGEVEEAHKIATTDDLSITIDELIQRSLSGGARVTINNQFVTNTNIPGERHMVTQGMYFERVYWILLLFHFYISTYRTRILLTVGRADYFSTIDEGYLETCRLYKDRVEEHTWRLPEIIERIERRGRGRAQER
jgi:hypothetical protein